MKKQKIKWDACLLAGMILLALLIGVSFNFMNRKEAAWAVVLQDGEETARYPLSEEQAVPVLCSDGGYNILIISGGTASISDADCPDRLCVRQKAIISKGESIICLPHKLVVLIDSMEEGEVDAIVN